MCGIVGKISFNNTSIYKEDLKRMADTISHRGPDGEGFWVNKTQNIGFGHRRLAIIDLSEKGHQPMHFNHLSITFNGEIYNYLELKEILIKKGYLFKTNTDTEVVLAAYQEYDEECLNYFDGMFAFAIWDENKKEVFAARDRFGEKPFYYFKNNNQFVFASEMKAIFATGIPKRKSDKAIFFYLTYDVIENPHNKQETFYEDIFQLPPSHALKLKLNGELTIKKYWDINVYKKIHLSEEDALEQFNALFKESIQRRLRSDVLVGSSFSGGIDSSSIVANITTLFPNTTLNTFTARFDDKNYDEGLFVESMLNQQSFTPNYCWPKDNLIVDELDKIFYHQEEPFGSTSIIAQWEVMKLAQKKNVTVLLDGQGADETLAGYYKYFIPFLSELYKTNRQEYQKQLSTINENLDLGDFLPKRFKLESKWPKTTQLVGNTIRPLRMRNIATDLTPEFINSHKKNPSPFDRINTLNDALYFDTFQYGLGKLLRFSDRNSMAFSREVRLPYLSHQLVEFVFSLPNEMKMRNGWSKYILRKNSEDIVPKEICWRKDKKGFQAPSSWMNNKKVQELVSDSINTLQKNKYVTSPEKKNNWKYIMVSKLLS